jgi:hypothetical protein
MANWKKDYRKHGAVHSSGTNHSSTGESCVDSAADAIAVRASAFAEATADVTVPRPQWGQNTAQKDECLSRVAQAISSGFTLIELLVYSEYTMSGC